MNQRLVLLYKIRDACAAVVIEFFKPAADFVDTDGKLATRPGWLFDGDQAPFGNLPGTFKVGSFIGRLHGGRDNGQHTTRYQSRDGIGSRRRQF
jgi:hypothetical protein